MRAPIILGMALTCLMTLALGRAWAGLDELDVRIGRALFNRAWLPAPASTQADAGLGPLFDARSCAACHRGGGRAVAGVDASGALEGRGVVLALARPDGSGDPVYGKRLQIDAVPGLLPEAVFGVRDTRLADGRVRRAPAVSELGYGPLDPETGLSLRVAPDLHGRGAIERIPDSALLAIEAEQASLPDGVHGRARRISLPDGRPALGRFGWKASQPTVAAATAEAFSLDLGLSTAAHPQPWGDCTQAEAACREAPHGGAGGRTVEIPESVVGRIVAYVASLPAPAGASDAAGERLFAAAGCAACHRPLLPTGDGGQVRLFSDLLLHDLGEGLADAMPEPGAGASEWRTAPLAGLSAAVAGETGLLHDGRARSVEEAALWHGGQAARAVGRFQAMTPADRAALLRYVSSL